MKYKLPLPLFIFLLATITTFSQVVNQSFYVDFGPNDSNNGNATNSPDDNGNHWNNATSSSPSGPILTLENQAGTASAYELDLLNAMSTNGINHGGLLAPEFSLLDSFAIATATQDYFFTTNTASIKFGNLNVDYGYRFNMFASRNNAQVRVTEYAISGLNSYVGTLQSSGPDLGGNGYNGNNSTVLISDAVFPDVNGEITLTVTRQSGSFAYLNVLKIEEFSEVDIINVTDINVTGEDITENGGTRQMETEVFPDNANIQDVTWSLDDNSVAKITATGLLIPYKNGTVNITARSIEEGSMVSGTKTVDISGQDVQNFLFDFGPDDGANGNSTNSPDLNGNYWNNIISSTVADPAINLINNENTSINYQLLITDDFSTNGLMDGGLTDPNADLIGAFAIPTVTQDYFSTSNSGTILFSNLNPDNGYRFHAFGSSAYTGPRKTEYIFSGLNAATGEIQTSGPELGGPGNNANLSAVYTSDMVFPDNDGNITLEVGVALGQFGYLNALRLTEFTDLELCPEVDELKISVMGSSVARGQGAPNDMGYAFLYTQLLEQRHAAAQGLDWGVTNISVGGNNTVNVLNRWVRDLLPQCGQYVIYGLSLGNEGIVNNGQSAFDQFSNNMNTLIDQANEQNIVPVVMNNYTRQDFDATDYNFIKQMNLLIHEWDVPSVNLLGAIDNGTGNWATGYQADFGHPNQAGHTEFFYAMVPSLFDALDAGKPIPERVTGTYYTTGSAVSEEPLTFIPENIVHPFTYSMDVKTTDVGEVARFVTPDGPGIIRIEMDGTVSYTAPDGSMIGGTNSVTDNEWHQITLSHYHAQGKTFLYTDANVGPNISERLSVDTFFVGGSSAPANMDIRDWFFYRSGMNSEEITAINEGRMLKSSLELYVPLDGQSVLGNFPFINLAQSTNRLLNDLSTSLKEIDNKSGSLDYRYFPNPVNEILNIEPLKGQTIEQVEILDITGRRLSCQKNTGQVSFKNLGAGVFFVKVYSTVGSVSGFKVVR